VYASACAACHGPRGEGVGDAPALAGGIGSLRSRDPVLTIGSYWPYATTVWDYIHRAMPYDRPGTLTLDQLYAVTAFVLRLNDIIDETTVLHVFIYSCYCLRCHEGHTSCYGIPER
jgi:S-disulfanyl-L-cysteine oxidoreductase SoxD